MASADIFKAWHFDAGSKYLVGLLLRKISKIKIIKS